MKIPSTNPGAGPRPADTIPSASKRAAAPNAQAASATNAPRAGDAAAPQGHPRLEAYAQKIQNRFEQAMASNKLTPRQHAALEAQRDRFQSLISRFENAYLDERPAVRRATAKGLESLLTHFASTVNGILGAGQAASPSSGPTVSDDAGTTRTGIDTLG